MKLYATPISHFSRKVRVLLDLYKAPYKFIDVGNVAEGDLETYAGNPLMKVPVLVDGEEWIIESDHIAAYLVSKLGRDDRYGVLTRDLMSLNIRAVLNGLMLEEVKVILARRTSVPTDNYVFFSDALDAIKNSLTWLEQHAQLFASHMPGYKEFHLVCAWEHLAYYDLIPLDYPRLREVVNNISPMMHKTSPFVLKPKGKI